MGLFVFNGVMITTLTVLGFKIIETVLEVRIIPPIRSNVPLYIGTIVGAGLMDLAYGALFTPQPLPFG